MLTQFKQLNFQADGRYATDDELQFLQNYGKTYALRLRTYQKIRVAEAQIIQQVMQELRSLDASLLMRGQEDLSAKWKQDTLRVLRYSACALLLDDVERLREELLFWMQTIMRSFGAQRSCDMTYLVMQAVVKQHLTVEEANLFCPILEVNRVALGDAVGVR